MTTITWPNTPTMRPQSVECALMLPEALSSSAFNQSTQSAVLGPAYWMLTITVGSRRASEVRDWEAWIAQFTNSGTRLLMWDWRFETPRGTAGGAPVFNGAGQTGNVLSTRGWPASAPALLMPGDYVGTGTELRKVVSQVASNGAGQATLTLDQPIRTSPADGQAIVTTRPTALFMCTTDKASRGFKQEGARHTGPTLAFKEVFA
jgi:hypothetical protein